MVVFILFFKKYFKKKNLYMFLDVLIFQFKISVFFSVVQVLLSLQSFPPEKKNRKKKKAKKKLCNETPFGISIFKQCHPIPLAYCDL